MNKPLTKRQEVLQFGRMSGIKFTSGKYAANDGASSPIWVNAYCRATEWADTFSSWEEAHTFFLTNSRNNTRPWAR